MPSLVEIPLNFVHVEWPTAEPFLAEAVKHSQGDLTVGQLQADVGQGRAKLYKFFADDRATMGAMVIEIYNTRSARIAFILALGGRGVIRYDFMEQLRNSLRQYGVTRIEGVGRDSVVRLYARLGFQKKYTAFGVDL